MNDRSLTSESTPPNQNALKIAGLYLLSGGLWIVFSDQLTLLLTRDPILLSTFSIVKGLGYIVVTAVLLYWLLQRHTAGLSQSEARYRSLFQNNHSVMLLIDPHSGAVVDANPSACAFYGYTHAEITSLQITAINQLSREQVFVEMERARQEERRHFFFQHRLASGEIRPVEIYSGPIEVQGHELLYSIVHDITARKQAETALHEMIENMAVAQRVAHFGSWKIELTGEPPRFGRMVWSDESYRIFGYEPGTIEADFEFFVKHVHPDDREPTLQAISTALDESKDYSHEYRIIRPDGAIRTIHAQAILFHDEPSGRVVKVTGTMHDITERAQAEVALRESEEKYRTLLEAMADGVFVAQDYRFIFANPALPAMLGYSHEVFVGLSFAEVIDPEFLPVWTERFTRRIASGPEPPKHYEVRFLCNGGGRSLWVELRASRIEYQGRPAVMGIIRDITERKKTQETLRENEERLRLALTAANQGLYDLNIQTGEAQVSPEYATMLGYDPATFRETNAAWIERLHPDDREPVADNYRAYIAGEVPAYAVEFRQRTQEGDWKWILSLGKIVAWDSAGRPLRLLGTHTDIHERKQTEQQLRYQANLLQNVSDAIIATDLDFKITSWNRAAEAIYGWSAAEVMGRSTTDLFQVEYNNFQPAQIDQHFQEEGFWQGEVTQKSKNGDTIQIMASVSLIRDSQGQPTGVVAVNRDLTAYRQAEAQLQQATTELIFVNDLLKHSTQPISVANMQGQFIRFNRAYEQLTGYQAEELLQLTYEQLTPEPWHEIEARHIATLLATGQAVRFEKEYRCKDGTITPVELVVELYRDAQGDPLYTYGFATDISERKRVEKEIQALASFPTENPNPILRVGLDGRLLYANPASAVLLEFWRCLPGEYVPHEWQDLITAAAAQTHLSVDVTCGPQTYSIQLASFAADGYVNFYGQDITQRQQAEAALRESESRFRQLAESLPQLVWTCQPDGSCDYLSQQWVAYTGIPEAEQLGFDWLEQLHPDDRGPTIAAWNAAVAAGSDFVVEFRIRHHAGVYRWFDTRAVRLRDAGGRTVKWFGSNTDIHTQRELREALRENEERLAFALEVSQMGSWEFNLVDHSAYRSLQHARIFGYEPPLPDWTFEMFLEHIIPEDRAEVEHTIGQAIAAQSDWSVECRIRRCDGEIRWVWVVGRFRNDLTEPSPKMVGGIVLDITERKQAEQALQTASRRFQVILSALYGGILVVSNDHRIEFANPAFCHMFDLDEVPDALLGLSAAEMIQKIKNAYADPAQAVARIREILAIGQPLKGEEIAMAGGRTYLRDFIPIMIDGKEYGRLWHHLDITARQQAEAALRQSEENFSKAFKSSPAALLLTRLADGQFIELNEAYCTIVGYDRAELIGRRTTEFNIYLDSTQRQAIVDQLRASGSARGFETSIRHRSGAVRHVVANQEIITFNGEACILSNLLDITERKQAEEALRQSEARYRLIADNTDDVIWLLSLTTGKFTYVSPSVQKLRGYTPEEVLTQTMADALTPESMTIVSESLPGRLERFYAGDPTAPVMINEVDQPRKDGSIVQTEVVTTLLTDDQGQVTEILGVTRDITERKQTEANLRELQNILATAEAVAGMGSWKWDLQTQKVTWSDEMFNLFGVDRANFDADLDRVIASRIHPDDVEAVNQSNLAVLEAGQPKPLEYRIVLPDGRQRYVWAEGTLVRDSSGHPAALTGYVQDITTRKQAEAALLASEARFRHTLDAMLEGCQIIAFDWRYLYINDVADRHNRRAKEELLGRRYMEMWPGIETTEVFRVIRRCMEERLSQSMENEFAFPDGSSGWFELRIYPVPEGIVILSLDITTRKRVEAQIQAQARRLQTLADTSRAFAEVGTEFQTVLQLIAHHIADHLDAGCVIRLLSEDGQWLETVIVYDQDPAALEVTETIIKNNIRYHIIKDALNPAVRAVLTGQPLLLPAVDPEQIRPFYPPELWLILEPYCPRSALIAPLQVQKHPVGTLSFSRYRPGQPPFNEDDLRLVQDLADRAALALSNARLFGQVQDELAERKRAEEELRQTAAELTRSNTDLEQFAYVASHDLQEPLRGIAGMLQLLQRRYSGQLDERADEFIHHAVEGATRMQTLINDLLVFSRVGTRGQPFRPVELADVLADVRANLTVAIRESGAVISHDNLPTVVADRTQMIQLFQNLIANAIKFRGEQVPDIRIRAEQQAGEWLFAVADNGIGLEAQYFDRIFGVFQRLHTRREYPGTGIGLALCKKIAERHGGRIWVESEPGQGSTFYFTLSVQLNSKQ